MAAAIAVVDPATGTPELDCFNAMCERWAAAACPTPAVFSYHLPALHGIASLLDLERRLAEGARRLAGVVVLGSAASVNEDEDWQRELNGWLLPKLHDAVPVLGLCYGHQLLAKLLPGHGMVSPVWADGEACVGLRRVELQPDELWHNEWSCGPLICSHKEGVTRLPDDMRALAVVMRNAGIGQVATSTFIDAMRHETLPIWGFQPHCEATDAFLQNNGIDHVDVEQRGAALPFGHKIVHSFLEYCVRQSLLTHSSVKAGDSRSRM